MTRQQAIKQLIETRDLSTGMLKPLGIPLEVFLRAVQFPDEKWQKFIDRAIAHYSKE